MSISGNELVIGGVSTKRLKTQTAEVDTTLFETPTIVARLYDGNTQLAAYDPIVGQNIVFSKVGNIVTLTVPDMDLSRSTGNTRNIRLMFYDNIASEYILPVGYRPQATVLAPVLIFRLGQNEKANVLGDAQWVIDTLGKIRIAATSDSGSDFNWDLAHPDDYRYCGVTIVFPAQDP
jgi:hypothetical protein